MIKYFKEEKTIDCLILKKIKELGLYGDYILARRLFNRLSYTPVEYSSYGLKQVIDKTITWAHSPQGSVFWQNVYSTISK